MSKKLTEKQKMFCREYIKDFNGTRAAIAAGYSEKGARVRAFELVTNSNIQAYIQKRIEKRNKRNDISADRVLQEYISIGLANANDFYENSGNGEPDLKDWDSIKKSKKAAIAGIKIKRTTRQTENGTIESREIELKQWNKIPALEKLALHTGLGAKPPGDPDKPKRSITINISEVDPDDFD